MLVSGAETKRPGVLDGTTIYGGTDIRFRVTGGKYRLSLKGTGIDLTAVGVGTAQLSGDLLAETRATTRSTAANGSPSRTSPRRGSFSSVSSPRRRAARRRLRSVSSATSNILVVEDESSIASFVSLYLKNAGYGVRTASNGTDALAQVAQEMPGLIVLDLMLPDIDGIEVTRRIRQTSDVPILMLTARDEDVDKIIGLEVGADDYLTKPFNPRELVARVKSILRRATPERRELESETMDHGDLHIDAGRREVRVGDEEIQLAPEGVRPAVGAARPPRSRAHARPAARARVGLHLRGRHADGRCARPAAAPQARRCIADRHGLGGRLQGVAGQGRQERPRDPVG